MRSPLAMLFFGALLPLGLTLPAQTPDWTKVDEEAMRHFQALVRIDSTDPPGNETKVAEYVRKVLEAEGIAVTLAAKDPARANLIARLKGNGSKRPLLIMGHSDTVRVDPARHFHRSAPLGRAVMSMAAARWTTRATCWRQ